ncbi:MAG: hypothetical protein EOM91_08620 [Sphingobacteriia bacterium]|nr:hypothetical protein [Sphingobacteriia bacterium]NCC40106.1 hypothetical protein [Gammaproteobacteria bacterium]
MERFDEHLHPWRRRSFDDAPPALRRRIFGVDYLRLRGRQAGELFVTRHGWPVLDSLVPSRWFGGERLPKAARALAGATGAVYRMPVWHPAHPRFALVIKFSRFGQPALLSAATGTGLDSALQDRIRSSDFLPPFEEFAHLERLRAAAGPRLRIKAPLAIYSPATRYLEWQLGRTTTRRWWYDRVLREDQATLPASQRVSYEWERIYILLYRWIDGIDAEKACESGALSYQTMVELTETARQVMRDAGWEVLDHKPRHVIVRPRGEGGQLLMHRGRIAWALIDYELLVPNGSTA